MLVKGDHVRLPRVRNYKTAPCRTTASADGGSGVGYMPCVNIENAADNAAVTGYHWVLARRRNPVSIC